MCEDIVHVDPLSPSSSYSEQSHLPKSRVKRDAAATSKTEHVTEVFASTKPYPLWWSEMEEHKVFRKHKSMGDAVLERNVCFVDTPGYGREPSAMELVLQYLEEQLSKTLSPGCMTERDLAGMLSGDGGTQVDLVLYILSQGNLCMLGCFTRSVLMNVGRRHKAYGFGFLTSSSSFYQRCAVDC